MIRRTLRAVVLLTAPLLVTPAACAENPVLVYAIVWVDSWTSSTARVCARGNVDDGAFLNGQWAFTVIGARADASVIAPPALTGSGDYFDQCQDVSFNNIPEGTFLAQLTFAGANITDVTGHAGILGAWEPIDGHAHYEVAYGFVEL